MTAHITPDLIRAALAHIPASLPREDWARVGMAIKSEFPDATGQDLFEAWSATADGHDPRATRSTWRSIKAGGGVGIGIGFAAMLYFFNIICNISNEAEYLKYFTPFQYAEPSRIFAESAIDIPLILTGITCAIVGAAIAVLRYNQKDIAA